MWGAAAWVLFEAPLDGRTTVDDVVGDDDVLWLPVSPGDVQYGAAFSAEAAGDLLVDAGMWQGMVNQQFRLLSALDRWIEQLERAHEDRTAAGMKAGEAVREEADRALLTSMGRSGRGTSRSADASDDAVYAACRAGGPGLGDRPFRARDGRRGQRPDRSGRAGRRRLAYPDARGAAGRALVADGQPARSWGAGPRRGHRWHCCGVAAVTRPSVR